MALEQRRQFNAIETQHACKIALIIRKDRPFSLEEFRRRHRVDLAFDHPVAIVTPEDAILSKLEWARKAVTPSDKCAMRLACSRSTRRSIACTSNGGHRSARCRIFGARSRVPSERAAAAH